VKIDWKHISIKDLAAIVIRKLAEKNIDVMLVGGACVSIYTKNKYISYDLDFVSSAPIKEISETLSALGFKRKSSRHFVHKDCPFFVEFVAPPASIGNEPVRTKAVLKTRYGNVILLNPTDTVKDRLAAFYHWNDPQAFEQAVLVGKIQKILLRDVKKWSEKEGHGEKYRIFVERLRKTR
jgi:hypothetical protein